MYNEDRAKLLGDTNAIKSREAQLELPHIAALTDFVVKLRNTMGPDAYIPYFDPWDGGIDAEVLFLLEAPGPKTWESGFVSRNNPDETAKNFFELNNEVGLDRKRTVIWNIVPWYIGTENKIRPANSDDIALGMKSIVELLRLLSNLKAIVLVGRKAQSAEKLVREIAEHLAIFKSPHPSPMFINRKPENRNKLREKWHEVKDYLDEK